MTVTKLKVALYKLGVEKSEYRYALQAMLQDQLQRIRTKTNMQHIVCQVILMKLSKPSSLCFTKNDVFAVSTLLGEVILIKLLFNFF